MKEGIDSVALVVGSICVTIIVGVRDVDSTINNGDVVLASVVQSLQKCLSVRVREPHRVVLEISV